MYSKIDVNEIKAFVESCGPDTRLYVGCDSEKIKFNGEWYADYILAVIVHVDGNHGGRIFGKVIRERDYDKNKNKPRMRLMNEAIKVAELYLELAAVVNNRDIEVHLDLNPDERFGSSCVVDEAIGYIRGMCNVIPMVKPSSWCASYCADRLKELPGRYNERFKKRA